ncbi:MAG TPA: hypothetical protein VHU87_01850 [Rhizomicrobium sp.]|jgi:hypothetical protein|nr:hypothetical protein [Rhizomicrobium sp.]
MKASVGQVIGFWTEDVLAPDADGGNYKYHLCVDADAGLHLFVCSNQYPFDFPLPKARCPGLAEDTSFISMSRVIRRSDIPRKHRIACRVTDEFLRELLSHIPGAKTLSENDKLMISSGIAKHLNQ